MRICITYLAAAMLVVYLFPFSSNAQDESTIAQPLSVRADAVAPDSSAMFEVQSTARGVLIPRMSSAQRQAIANPATGLLVFDSDETAFYFYDGNQWLAMIDANSTLWK